MKKRTNRANKINNGTDTRTSQSLKFSVRINKFVTSISIKKNICSLWVLKKDSSDDSDRSDDSEGSKGLVLDFIYESIALWNSDTAKGFSDFITERMIKDITRKNFIKYKKIHRSLK